MRRRTGRLLRLLSVAVTAAVATSLLAQPAAADHQCTGTFEEAPKTGTLYAECMDASQVKDPPGSDSPGQGTATIWIDMRVNVLRYEVHTVGLTLPIHGALVYEGEPGETGPQVYTLFGRRMNENPSDCTTISDPSLRDLLQKSKPFFLEIYDDLWRDGAIRGQLEYVNKDGGSGLCTS